MLEQENPRQGPKLRVPSHSSPRRERVRRILSLLDATVLGGARGSVETRHFHGFPCFSPRAGSLEPLRPYLLSRPTTSHCRMQPVPKSHRPVRTKFASPGTEI